MNARMVPLFLGLLLLLAPAARADDPARPEKTSARRNQALVDAFTGVAKKVLPSVAAIASQGGDELGYGIAIGDGTLILTSRSILEGAQEIVTVRSARGGAVQAVILARNEAYDVALVRLKGPLDLAPIALGSSRGLAIGEFVVTVGAAPRPLAVGVVSALERRVEQRAEARAAVDLFGIMNENNGPTRAYARVIQHDSPLDASREGGTPLVDKDGRLVGINVASAYRGSSYAAPIDDVKEFLADMEAGKSGPGMPAPGFLGVGLSDIASAETAKAHGLHGPGAEINTVFPGSAAAKAGMKKGDAILEIDGERIHARDRVAQVIRAKTPGTSVRLRILSGGEEREVQVTIGERPKN